MVFAVLFCALFLVDLSVGAEAGRNLLPVGRLDKNSCLDVAVAEDLVGSASATLDHLSRNFLKLNLRWLELFLDLLKYVRKEFLLALCDEDFDVSLFLASVSAVYAQIDWLDLLCKFLHSCGNSANH